MSAPAKTTGGNQTRAAKAPSAPPSARGSARSKRRRSPASASKPTPPRYDTTTSARPRIVEVARELAIEHGYERLRLCDITERAEISHQGFYLHFANKRHAVAAATSDSLEAMAAMLAKESEGEAIWAERLLGDLDRTLDEIYPSADGPDRWLYEHMVEIIAQGTYEKTKVAELVEVSGVSHGDFYRRWGGKKPCLQRIYATALADLSGQLAEAEPQRRIAALGQALVSDPDRALLLLRGAAHLPTGPERERALATQHSLPTLIRSIVAEALGEGTDSDQVGVLCGAILEVSRSAVLSGDVDSLDTSLRSLQGGLLAIPTGSRPGPRRERLRLSA